MSVDLLAPITNRMNEWVKSRPGEPVRCPANVRGRPCNRAQDLAGTRTTVFIREAAVSLERGQETPPVVYGLDRKCQGCGTRLEILINTIAEES